MHHPGRSPIAYELGASVAMVGLLLSPPFWIPAILAKLIGSVVGHCGARRTMLVGGTGMLVAPWITVLIPSTLGLVITLRSVRALEVSRASG